MKKKKLIITLLILIVVVAISLYFVFKRRSNSTATDDTAGGSGSGNSGSNSAFPLRKGSRGEYVKTLQRKVNLLLPIPYARLEEDGIWGDKTEDAVMIVYKTNTISETFFYSNIKN